MQVVGGAATGCRIAPLLGLPVDFHFQTTDPSTNALTGSLDTPADIPDGGLQTSSWRSTRRAASSHGHPAPVHYARTRRRRP
jgi:hypothetical protein